MKQAAHPEPDAADDDRPIHAADPAASAVASVRKLEVAVYRVPTGVGFEALHETILDHVRRQPGAVVVETLRDLTEPTLWVDLVVWSDQAAFEAATASMDPAWTSQFQSVLSVVPASPAAAVAAPDSASTKVATIPVAGMTCGSCAANITAVLDDLEGVTRASVDLKKGHALVHFDPKRVALEAILDAITSVGFEPGKPVVRDA